MDISNEVCDWRLLLRVLDAHNFKVQQFQPQFDGHNNSIFNTFI